MAEGSPMPWALWEQGTATPRLTEASDKEREEGVQEYEGRLPRLFESSNITLLPVCWFLAHTFLPSDTNCIREKLFNLFMQIAGITRISVSFASSLLFSWTRWLVCLTYPETTGFRWNYMAHWITFCFLLFFINVEWFFQQRHVSSSRETLSQEGMKKSISHPSYHFQVILKK